MFELGELGATPGVIDSISQEDIENAITRHLSSDWGNISEEDWKENDYSVENELRILSSYTSSKGIEFWILTEADRSSTLVLLPEEY